MANSAVFNFWRNAGSDWISLTEVGREFQACDAAAGNARSPMVARRVGGTKRTGDGDVLVHQPSIGVSQHSASLLLFFVNGRNEVNVDKTRFGMKNELPAVFVQLLGEVLTLLPILSIFLSELFILLFFNYILSIVPFSESITTNQTQ